MWLEVDNLRATVIRAEDAELDWLAEYLSFPDARFRKQGGKVRMLDPWQRFPAGLLPLVRRSAPKAGYRVEVADRTRPTPPDPAADLAWLLPHQLDAALAALDHRRGIIWLPTAGGKGEIAVGLARAVPTEWLFLVHRGGLAGEVAERFGKRNREHGVEFEPPDPASAALHRLTGRFGRPASEAGVICEGQWTEGQRLTCATYQSIDAALRRNDQRARELLDRVGGVLCDEAHTVGADGFWRIAMSTPNAAYRVGLSGTPLARSDRRSALVVAALGPVVYRLRAQVLIDSGAVARPRIRMVQVHQACSRRTYQGVYGELVVRGARRNAVLVAATKRAEKPCFVFVKEVEHGKRVERLLLAAGVRAQFVWGDHSLDWRRTAVRSLMAGRLEAVVCSAVFQEGEVTDISELRSVVVGAGGRSVIATIQRVGRGMRAADGKDEFEVWDVMDEGQEWLARAAAERRDAYLAEGYSTTVVTGASVGLA